MGMDENAEREDAFWLASNENGGLLAGYWFYHVEGAEGLSGRTFRIEDNSGTLELYPRGYDLSSPMDSRPIDDPSRLAEWFADDGYKLFQLANHAFDDTLGAIMIHMYDNPDWIEGAPSMTSESNELSFAVLDSISRNNDPKKVCEELGYETIDQIRDAVESEWDGRSAQDLEER